MKSLVFTLRKTNDNVFEITFPIFIAQVRCSNVKLSVTNSRQTLQLIIYIGIFCYQGTRGNRGQQGKTGSPGREVCLC